MPKGKHRRVGQKPKQQKPLELERLPLKVRGEILKAREQDGCTWEEVSERALDAAGIKDPAPNVIWAWQKKCRRWFDLRIEQQRREKLERHDSVRELAEALAAKGFGNLPAAALNALAGEALSTMDAGTREERQASLGNLVSLLAKLMTAQASKDKVELEKQKLDARREALRAIEPREIYLAATEELIKRLRTRKSLREALDPIQRELIEELSKSAESFAKRIEAQSTG